MIGTIGMLLCASCTEQPRQQEKPAEKKIKYESLLADVKKKQAELQGIYAAADSAGRDSLVKAARSYVFSLITEKSFPCWFNTPWDFNGTTRKPGEGSIACGYFVTTVLFDAGFYIPRTKWAQMASEPLIKKLSSEIRRFHNKSIQEVSAYIKGKPDGLYIAGLDSHVGFIYKSGPTIRFVHSNYYEPEKGVMAQELSSNNPLRDSHYRVIGRILDDTMMKAWLSGDELK